MAALSGLPLGKSSQITASRMTTIAPPACQTIRFLVLVSSAPANNGFDSGPGPTAAGYWELAFPGLIVITLGLILIEISRR